MHWVQQAQGQFRVLLLPSGTWQPGASLLDTPPLSSGLQAESALCSGGVGLGTWGPKLWGSALGARPFLQGRRVHRPVGESRHSGRAVGVTTGEQQEPRLGLDPTRQPAGLSVLGLVRPRVQG